MSSFCQRNIDQNQESATAVSDATNAPCCQKRADVTFRPSVDIADLGPEYEIRMDLPGAAQDSIEITVHEGVLSVQAIVPDRSIDNATALHTEYAVGDFRRRVRLGEDIDTERIGASYVTGVLTLTLPKRTEAGPKRIAVTDR